MARTLLTTHPAALAAFKSLCAERRFNHALGLIADGGAYAPFSAPRGEAQSGGFCLKPSACDGDADLEAFRAWARGQGEAADAPTRRNPYDASHGALVCDFGPGGAAVRDWTGGLP